jgi:gliding motility-associated-like protein
MNPTISGVTSANDGTYSLVITVGSDTSDPVTTDVVISPNTNPIFDSGGTYCSGEYISALPTTSNNSITGTWSPAINNTATTTYTFTPTTGQCAFTTTNDITITPNTNPTFNAVGPYCSGESISALPTTSTNAITGSWSPAINNTTTTTYTFTPNAGQCALTTTLSINITAQTTPTFTQLAPYCEDDAVPNLATTSNNGISGNWSPAINNTTTTTYTFTPNAGQCATTTSMIITINPNISPSFTQVGPFCSGESISSIPTTSNNSITGTWSPTINNIATTTYTFTPNTGQCTLTTTMQIIVNDNLLPEFDPIGPYCYGNPITALPTNSNNGINGTWSPAIDNTTTTTYTFTTTIGQCASTAELDITIELLESELISTTNQFCDAYGTAEVSGLNGTQPYSYIWPANANGINNGQANELIAGDYIVSLTDFIGCQTTQALTIGFTDNMDALAALNANPSCYGEPTGSIDLSITNGTGPYNIIWDSTSIESNSANYTANYLFAGEYDFTISDINGCQADASFELNNPPLLVAAADYVQIACVGETAIVNLSASGGTPSYSGIGSFETNSGTFIYTVTDSNGCIANAEITVPEAPAPLEITANTNDITCFNEDDGSISIYPSGGTGPFYYSWSNEENTENITNLSPGTYSVEVTDYNGCTQSGAYSIVEPNSIDLTYTTNNLLCYDYADGSVEMYASGGITPYFYDIYNPRFSANGASHNNLAADTYTIRVSDAHGCTNSKSINILGPSELICAVSTTNPSCIGNNDGIIELYANGGTAPYSYVYEEMYFPTGIITGISEGIYNAQIIDANNCTKNINQISLFDNPVDCINIPNAFTPNADGINDTWLIDNIDMFPSAYIYVYNRWGQELYSTRGEGEPWSGKYMGKVVPTATYLYLINLYNGTKPYNGTVTIVY